MKERDASLYEAPFFHVLTSMSVPAAKRTIERHANDIGGDTATADMDGSVRCFGHAPFTISTTTPSGVTASASGTTVILTSMPRSLRLTAVMISPPIRDRAHTAEDIAGSLHYSSSAAMTAAKLPASPSIRFSRRYSRMKRSGPLWANLPTHGSSPPR